MTRVVHARSSIDQCLHRRRMAVLRNHEERCGTIEVRLIRARSTSD